MEPLTLRELFGGAIEFGIPGRFEDVSQIREIPDNQEVFADPHSDQSVIIELLSQENIPLEAPQDAAKFFFDELATANEALSSNLFHWELLQPHELPYLSK